MRDPQGRSRSFSGRDPISTAVWTHSAEVDALFRLREESEVGRQVAVVLYVMAMAAIIVGVDFVFFRNRFWGRLTVNIGIVLVFAAFYLRFLRRP